MPASYLFPPDKSQAKSVALTPYASGILVAKWDEPITWYWSGSSFTSAAWSLSTNSGFSAATIGASSDAWLPQYYGGIAHYTSGGAQTEYVLPQADLITGCAYVPAYNCLYTIGATGNIYNIGSGITPPVFMNGHSRLGGPDILGANTDVLTVGSGFVENTSWFLSTSGTTLFTILGQKDSLGYFSLSASGVGTSGAITLPMTVPSCLTAYTPVSAVAVGGWSYAAAPSGFSYMFSDPESYWTVGLTPLANTIGIYKTSPWGFLSFSQAITGFALPEFGDWSPDGLHLAVSYASTGVAIFRSVFNTITYQVSLPVSGAGQVAFVSPENFIVCQEKSNQISTFYATGNAWVQSNSLSLVEPSTIARTGPFSAAVGYSSGIAFVNVSQANQLLELNSTVSLSFKPSSIASDTNGNIYAVGTQAGVGLLSIVSGQAVDTTLTWDGSGNSVAVFQDQILVIDAVYPVLRIFGYYQSSYQQISATLHVPSDVSGGVFVTSNTPFSSGGVIFVCGSGTAWSYEFVSPFGVANTPVGVVSVYHNGSWTTTGLGSGKVPSALAYDFQSNLWVTTVQNDLYSLGPFGTIHTHEVVTPYTGQRSGVPLGFSSLVTSGTYIYGSSSLNGALVYFHGEVGGGLPSIPLPGHPQTLISMYVDAPAYAEFEKPLLGRNATFIESKSISFEDINISIEAPPPTWVLTVDSRSGLESKDNVMRNTLILDENN